MKTLAQHLTHSVIFQLLSIGAFSGVSAYFVLKYSTVDHTLLRMSFEAAIYVIGSSTAIYGLHSWKHGQYYGEQVKVILSTLDHLEQASRSVTNYCKFFIRDLPEFSPDDVSDRVSHFQQHLKPVEEAFDSMFSFRNKLRALFTDEAAQVLNLMSPFLDDLRTAGISWATSEDMRESSRYLGLLDPSSKEGLTFLVRLENAKRDVGRKLIGLLR